MGILARLRKKNSSFIEEENESMLEEVEYPHVSELLTETEPDKKQGDNLEECVDLFIRATMKLDDYKLEYEQTTAYLTDIQLIDQAMESEKEELTNLASEYVKVSGNREYLKENAEKLSDLQFKFMQLHEDEIPQAISRIREEEDYNSLIQDDLWQIQKTKTELKDEERFLLQRMNGVRLGMYAMIFIAILFCCLLAFINVYYIFPIFLWYLGACVTVSIVGTMLLLKYRHLNQKYLDCGKKMERAIHLENKVKIKYVNNTNALDYLYTQYNVGSSRELLYTWKQYTNILEEERLYRKSTTELNEYSERMLKILKNFGLHDSEIWLYQAEALMNPKEMVEVTHRLNIRRQKVREQLKMQEDVCDMNVEAIRKYLEEEPEKRELVNQKLRPLGIRL